MRLIELTGVKGGTVWVNPDLLLWVGPPEGGAQASMYGDTNARTSTRLRFGSGELLEVRESLADVVARLTA
ncbi:MAG TPA: hypothetical protein VME40_11135 [Caulobacteraceae bacterium]|nr:hypothetical protein [Caulobacteraceae bacterium]